MKTLIIPGSGLLLLILLTGCTSVKRFKSASYKGEDHNLVDMTLFRTTLGPSGPEKTGKSLWDLSADAQTQMIRIYNERYPDNGQFNAALNQEYLVNRSGPVADFTHRDMRMVFTISKEKDYTTIGESGSRFSPADRIEYMKFSLEIPAVYSLRFTGWNKYSTEYGEIDIADMSFSRSIDLNADVSTEFVEGGIKSSSTRKEDQSVRSRYLQLNGSISPRRIEMEAEGTREIDLAGNVVADVSMAFAGFPEIITQPVYPAGNGTSPSQLTFMNVMVPRISTAPDSIMVTLEIEYVYRHVKAGWKSYQEWDDRVVYYSGKVSKPISLFKKDEYLPLLYKLGTGESETLKVNSASGITYPLQFINYHEALRFLEWLTGRASLPGDPDMALPVEIGESTLMRGDQPLTPAMVSSMKNLRVLPKY
ncbi:MAG: hypothetical protein GY790_24365 [Bacteroidetes bacterium]|nr:hypothetical protein [Bacteroidota bacterium]